MEAPLGITRMRTTGVRARAQGVDQGWASIGLLRRYQCNGALVPQVVPRKALRGHHLGSSRAAIALAR